jgi:hypothetical protein
MNTGKLVWHDQLGLGKVITADFMRGWNGEGRKIIRVAFLNFWPLVECTESDLKEFDPSDEFKLVLNKLVRSELGQR